jgi:hypothetical protein
MKNEDVPNCVDIFSTDPVVRHVRAIQGSMKKSAEGCFSESELEHLRAVIRLTVELHEYFQLPCTHPFCLTYVSESVFSGIDSYTSVTQAYKVLVGAAESQMGHDVISVPELKVQFASMFEAFDKEDVFESKCRLLLDLYKLMIIFAGISYDG